MYVTGKVGKAGFKAWLVFVIFRSLCEGQGENMSSSKFFAARIRKKCSFKGMHKSKYLTVRSVVNFKIRNKSSKMVHVFLKFSL